MRASWQAVAKRAQDILGSLALLILGAPVIGLVAAIVRVRLGAPVIFRQLRPGKEEQPFVMWKFRTMVDAADSSGRPLPDGQRMTPVGAFLRRSSLDELPELVNVLKGDMSLVGPRPLLLRYTEFMTPAERRRYSVRPGITGLAQINGRNSASWDERLALDVWYVDHQSLLLDLKILVHTLAKVVKRSDVHVDAESVMRNLDDERRQAWPQ